jgi:hypothetical protein
MRRTSFACLALALVLAPACNPSEEDVDEEAVASATQAITATAGPAVAFSAPVATSSPSDLQPGGDLGETELHALTEDSVSGSGLVGDPSCVSFAWNELSLTATFDQCELEATGAILDGVIVLTIHMAPAGVQLAFMDLTVDGVALDGSLDLRLAGQLGALQAQIAADLSIGSGGSSVTFTGVELTADASGATVSGDTEVETPSFHDTVTLTNVHWDRGLCHPVSGTLDLEESGIPVVVTFLPTTSADGKVLLKIGSAQPVEQQLLQPCP